MKHNVKQLQLQDLFIGAWVQEYLEMDLNATGGSVIVAPGGHVILSEQNPFRCFSVGDNGVMSGSYYDGEKSVLAIIKDGEISECSQNAVRVPAAELTDL